MRAVLVGCAALLAACSPAKQEPAASASAAVNAIDCASAASPAEKAICADPELIKLDGEIGAAYSAALGRYASAPEADDALRGVQRLFNEVRENDVGGADAMVTLDERMEAQRRWLGALQAPRAGFVGDWGNLSAEVTITENADKTLSLAANAAEPTRGSWICDLQGALVKDGDGLKLATVSKNSTDLGGWTVRIVREGALLKVLETAPPNATPDNPASRPYCGMNGGFEGAFLPTDKALYQLP